MNKKWPKNSIVNDAAKRRAMHRFTKGAKGTEDRRIGLALLLSWDAGYESARKRFTRAAS